MSEFSRKELKAEFQSHYMNSSLSSMRLGLYVSLILFLLFVFFNLIFFRNSPEYHSYLRFGIIAPVIIISISVTYFRSLYKWLSPIFIFLNLIIGLGILVVGMETSPIRGENEYYFAWVMLVVIGFFTFFRVPFYTLISIGAFQVMMFMLATFLNGTYKLNPFGFFNDFFFVIAIYSIGLIMALMFRILHWKNFLHKKALSENYRKLLQETEDRKIVAKSLQQSEFLYINTLNSIPDWLYVVDTDLRFVMLNSSLQEEHLRQGFPINCIGKKITKVYPFIQATTIDEINRVFKTGEIVVSEQQFFLRDKTIYGETRKVPIFKDNQVIQVMTIMRNRSKEREVEELKQKNVEQKEIMLKEIHHRVKNNLAIVVSLLNLQLHNNSDPELSRIILDVEMRIRSMALIHEHLYRSENLEMIPLPSYLQSLSEIIASTFNRHKVTLITNFDSMEVTIELALPLGLIANELLTNAYKYAFPIHNDGVIEIQLQKENGNGCAMIIKDHGVGLPPEFTMDAGKSLGMFIVKLLVEQINGKIEILNNGGATFIIRFNEKDEYDQNKLLKQSP
ncbi:MAG: histidine kinase dimerization/phosphoacceptor domain -containing protein [Bacteroidota bacterium]